MTLTQTAIKLPRSGLKAEVWQKGRGRDLVFLHGAGGQAAWTPDLEALSKSFRVTVPLHPGYGQTEGVEDIDDVLDSVLHTFNVLEALGIERPHVVGHSMGGMIAAEMAAIRPKEVASLCLVCPVGLWDDEHPVLDFFAHTPQDLMPYIFVDTNHPMAQAVLIEQTDEDVLVEMLVNYTKSLAAAGRLLWPIPDRGLKKRIAGIKAPTQIIWGESDGLVPVFYAHEFKRRIRGAKVKIIRKASHMVLIERPEEYARTVCGFIDGVAAKALPKKRAASKMASAKSKGAMKKKSARKRIAAKQKSSVKKKLGAKKEASTKKKASAKKTVSKSKRKTQKKKRTAKAGREKKSTTNRKAVKKAERKKSKAKTPRGSNRPRPKR